MSSMGANLAQDSQAVDVLQGSKTSTLMQLSKEHPQRANAQQSTIDLHCLGSRDLSGSLCCGQNGRGQESYKQRPDKTKLKSAKRQRKSIQSKTGPSPSTAGKQE